MITWRFADVNKLPEESGIYMILNILNNHKYVGSTNNFKRRLTIAENYVRINIIPLTCRGRIINMVKTNS